MRLIVTGTDTNVGKTIFSAALTGALGASYWKPFQAGLEPVTDTERVRYLSGRPGASMIPEAFRLRTPVSVHRAAEIDGVTIDCNALVLPNDDPLVIEGAGGALVPVTRAMTMADLFALWGLPVIVVARTLLGTINHSLMTIEALRSRGAHILGIAFVGEAQPDSERTIAEMGRVRRLGRLPILMKLERDPLARAFDDNFDIEDFR